MNIPKDSNLKPAHYQEWLASGISPEIIALNVRSVDGQEAIERILGDAISKRQKVTSYATVGVAKLLEIYSPLENGGWWVNGIDPLNDYQPMEWGQLKPDSPRIDLSKAGKKKKYEAPLGVEPRCQFLRQTFGDTTNTALLLGVNYGEKFAEEIRAAIESIGVLSTTKHATSSSTPTDQINAGHRQSDLENSQYSRQFGEIQGACSRGEYREALRLFRAVRHLARDNRAQPRGFDPARDSGSERLNQENPNYWRWVHDRNLPIALTEGAKKAASFLKIGISAIALPGITMGVRTTDADGVRLLSPHLVPDLAFFATPGREVSVCFDYETKPKTISDIQHEIAKLKTQFLDAGCQFKVIDLPGPEKGVDDFIVAQGEEAFHKVYKQRRTYEQWLASGYNKLTFPVSQALNQRYLGALELPDTAKIVGLKSPKGTGKTEAFIPLVAAAMERGQRVLLISHRVQLAEAICNRIGLNYVTEVRGSDEGDLLGYGLCIDSLHPESQARFNADHWHDALIIIDEAEQVAWHLLEAKTEVANNRITILEQLKILLINTLESATGRVILADADLSDLSINLVHGLLANQPPPHLIVNSWQPDSEAWQVYNYAQNRANDWLCGLDQELGSGGKTLVVLQSQKRKSRFSTTTLEALFNAKYPHLKILRIDSESIADPTHPAFKCTEHINEVVSRYDCVLASPTLETGVSIDIRGHFTSVWGCMNGVLPENTARQSLARVRDPVDRHIWIRKRGFAQVANGFSTKKAILAGEYRQAKVTEKFVQLATTESPLTGSYECCLQVWAKMAARVNCGLAQYRQSVLEGLEREGHHVYEIDAPLANIELLEELETLRKRLYQEEREAIANADGISATTYEKLKGKKAKTAGERHQERKYSIESRYQVDEVTPELIEKDDDGWYPKLRLHYYLGMGKPFLKHRDEQSLEHTLKTSGAWLPTTNRAQLSTRCWLIEQLGVMALLNLDEDFNGGIKAHEYEDAHPALLRLANLAKRNSWDVKNVIGVTVNEKMSPIQIAQTLLGKLGIKLKFLCQEGGKGNRQRVYRYELPKDGRDAILAGWFTRDLSAQQQREEEAVHTPSNKDQELLGGVA